MSADRARHLAGATHRRGGDAVRVHQYRARMTRSRLYFDTPWRGLDPESSHPAFVALAPPTFYDAADEFAPFGSDSGNDTLRRLEECVSDDTSDDDVLEAFSEWLTDDEIWSGDSDVIDERLSSHDGYHENHLRHEAQVRIAVAVGLLKIKGYVTPELRRVALFASAVQQARLELATERYPAWPHRPAAEAGLNAVRRALASAPIKGSRL